MFTFKTVAIRGRGRGTKLGFPTINMQIPPEVPLSLPDGVYAARITLGKETYGGALFYGPIPVFNQEEKSLEVYLVDSGYISVNDNDLVTVSVVRFIRNVQNFSSPELMILQMEKDVLQIRNVLGV